MFRTIAAGAAALILFVAGASASTAAPLTADEAKRFVASLPAAHEFGQELEAEGRADALEVELQPKAGEPFQPYSRAVEVMKTKFPADHARLGRIVSPHGFTAESWASVGDRVMIAYMAERMEKEDPEAVNQMAAMDPAMLDMLPPEMKAQIAPMLAMLAAVREAPAADRAAIRPVMGELDAYIELASAE